MRIRFPSHTRLYILVVVYLLLTTAYNVTIPLARGDDEYGHFRYVRFIAEKHHLPFNQVERGQASYVSIYPPLYYGLAAILFSWIDSSKTIFKEPLKNSPQQALVHEVLDVHWIFQTEVMNYPYHGAVLLWHLSRLFSSLLSAGVLIVTYFATLELFPGQKTRALLAAATLAFIPRFIYTSSTVNNDNMIALLMAVYLWLMVRLVKGHNGWRLFVLLGLTLGLAIMTKYTVGLVPLTMALFFCFLAWRQRWPAVVTVKRIAVVALSALLVTSGWFAFLVWNFNEIETQGLIAGTFNALMPQVATNVSGAEFLEALQGQTATPGKKPLIFSDWLAYFGHTFWAVSFSKSRTNFPLSPGAFWGVACVAGVALIGLVMAWRRGNAFQRTWLELLGMHLLSFPPLMLIRYTLNGRIEETAQGRHVLTPAALAVGILIMVGWWSCTSPRLLRWLRPALPTLLLFWSVAQLYIIHNTYPKPLPISVAVASQPQVETRVNHMFFDAFELVGYSAHILPNEAKLEAKLVWQAHQPASKDYMTEVRLVDQTGQIVSSWLRHPANGLYPTRAWLNGEIIYDRVEIPLYHVPPGLYTLEAYLLEAYQQPAPEVAGPLFTMPITLDKAPQSRLSSQSLPIQIGNQTVQVGYQLWPFNFFDFSRPPYRYRAAIPILWEVNPLPPPDQLIKLKLVAPDGRVFEPLGAQGNLKTFIVGADWPAGSYRLKAEVVQKGGIMGENLSSSLLRVENRERPFTSPPLPHPVEANFYDYIKLLGYDLPASRIKSGQELPVFVYWQDLQMVNANLIMFNHLYDMDNKLWASFDHILPPYYGGPIMWVPGEVVSDGYTIPIAPTVPDGIYTLRVGLFLGMGQDAWTPLPLVNKGQVSDVTYVTLGPIKIGSPPAAVLTSDPHPQYPRNDNLGGLMKLRGYDLVASAEARELELTLYWESLVTTEKDYTTFVHLTDENGQIIAQKDGPPAGGAYPTSLWDINEVIKDKVTLTLPSDLAATDYQLFVGMYDFSTGQRLMDRDSETDAILLSSVQAGNVTP